MKDVYRKLLHTFITHYQFCDKKMNADLLKFKIFDCYYIFILINPIRFLSIKM